MTSRFYFIVVMIHAVRMIFMSNKLPVRPYDSKAMTHSREHVVKTSELDSRSVKMSLNLILIEV